MDLNQIKEFFGSKTEEEVNQLLTDANLSLGDYTELVMAIDNGDEESLKRIITKNSSIADMISKQGLVEYSNPEDKKNFKKYKSDKALGYGNPKGRSPVKKVGPLGESFYDEIMAMPDPVPSDYIDASFSPVKSEDRACEGGILIGGVYKGNDGSIKICIEPRVADTPEFLIFNDNKFKGRWNSAGTCPEQLVGFYNETHSIQDDALVSMSINESKEEMEQAQDFGCGAYTKLLKTNPKYDNERFEDFVIVNNRADRDSGEFADISQTEIDRLVQEYDRTNISESQDASMGDTMANKTAFTDNERDMKIKQAIELETLKDQQKLQQAVLDAKHKAEKFSKDELEQEVVDTMTQARQSIDIEVAIAQPVEPQEEIEDMDFTGVNLEDLLVGLTDDALSGETREKKSDGMITVTEDFEETLTGEEQRDLDKSMKELESKPGSDISVIDGETNTAEDGEFVGFDDESGSAIVKDQRGDVSIVDATKVSMKEGQNYQAGDKTKTIEDGETVDITIDKYDNKGKAHFTRKDGTKGTQPVDMFENSMRDIIKLCEGTHPDLFDTQKGYVLIKNFDGDMTDGFMEMNSYEQPADEPDTLPYTDIIIHDEDGEVLHNETYYQDEDKDIDEFLENLFLEYGIKGYSSVPIIDETDVTPFTNPHNMER